MQPSGYFNQPTSIYGLASEAQMKESSGRTCIINKSDYEVSVTIHLKDKTLFIFFHRRTKTGETLHFLSHHHMLP